MNTKLKQGSILAIAALLGGTLQSAHAATAQASFDWNSLSISYVDFSGGTNAPVLTFNAGSIFDTAYAYNSDDSKVDSTDSATTPLSATLSNSHEQASAQKTIEGQFTVSVMAYGSGSSYGYAFADSTTGQNFTLSGQGLAVITLNWSIAGNGEAGSYDDEAHSSVSLSTLLDDSAITTQYSSIASGSTLMTGIYSQRGTLTLALVANGITTEGYFWAETSATAYSIKNPEVQPVPAPAAAWLFGSSMLGLAGIARRKIA